MAPGDRGLSSIPQRLESELQESLAQEGASSADFVVVETALSQTKQLDHIRTRKIEQESCPVWSR